LRLPRRRAPACALLAISLTAAPVCAAEEPATPATRPEERLAEIRRLLREEGKASASAAALAASFGSASDLWTVRLRIARAVMTSPDEPASTGVPDPLESSRLGLPGLGSWVLLRRSRPSVETLLSWAAAEPFEPLARDAVLVAARQARTAAEKRAVRDALEAWERREPRGPRAAIGLALARARVASTPAAARRLRMALAAAWPDAPERATDLFDAVDRREFEAVIRSAPGAIRAARALALARSSAKEAAKLIPRSPAPGPGRLDAAEARLVLGDPKEALRLLRLPHPDDERDALRALVLELDAEMRLLLREEGGSAHRRHAGRRRGRPATTLPALPKPFDPPARARAEALLSRSGGLLARPVPDTDRRRLLADAGRLSLRSGRGAEARRLVRQLVLLDPSATVLSEDLFREAFEAFRAGHFAEAETSWKEQATLYRDASVRRRAIYWAARALEKAGQTEAARRLQASLVAGTSPDLYALWAAAILGLPSPAGPLPAPREGESSDLDGTVPASPSRELLACGLPGLAEDAAEAEGTADLFFLAAVASERGDYRRAAALLKQRWPELGSPEEGSVPLAARRAYYPCAQGALLREIAVAASVAPALVFGLVRQESIFTADIRSRSGAVGLMQLMPATGRQLQRRGRLGARPDLKNPAVNVRLGVTYLHQLLEVFGGDVVLALAAYNAGPARARRWKRDLAPLPTDEFVESIPIAESRVYIRKILFFEGAYAALYGLPASPPPSFVRRDAADP
jgi:soluble lytic murein transglycosylase-like protein